MEYDKRIGDEYLNGDYVDGQILQHSDLNELENIVKTGINANYADIQRIETNIYDTIKDNTLIAINGFNEDNPAILMSYENGGYLVKNGCWCRYASNYDSFQTEYDMIILITSLNANYEFCPLENAVLRLITQIQPGAVMDGTYDIVNEGLSLQNYVRTDMSIIPGYKPEGNQILKNIDGTPTWVDEV